MIKRPLAAFFVAVPFLAIAGTIASCHSEPTAPATAQELSTLIPAQYEIGVIKETIDSDGDGKIDTYIMDTLPLGDGKDIRIHDPKQRPGPGKGDVAVAWAQWEAMHFDEDYRPYFTLLEWKGWRKGA